MDEQYDAGVLIGPAGAGKDSLWPQLITHRPRFEKVITTTTREMRLEPVPEINGVDYHFATNEKIEEQMLNDELLECAVIHSRKGRITYYGNTRKEYERIKAKNKIPLYVIDVQGADALSKKLKLFTVMVLPFDPRIVTSIDPYLQVLEERMIARKNHPADIARRLDSARIEIPQYSKYSRILVNAQGMREEAAKNLVSLFDEAFPEALRAA